MKLRLVVRTAFGLTAAGLVGGLVLGAGSRSLHAQTRGAVPTYSKDVAPILNAHCAGCHRPGEMAPMSLLTYDNVRPYGRVIGQKVADGTMPPWHAESPLGMFKNDPRLNATDKATIAAWVAGGFPQGDPKDLPKAPEFVQGWTIGKPDLILSMSKPFDVPATGTIAYQNFVIPTNFTEDKWIQAVEVRAGSPSVVHHVLVYSREPDTTPRAMPFRNVQPASAAARPAAAPAAPAPASPEAAAALAARRAAAAQAAQGQTAPAGQAGQAAAAGQAQRAQAAAQSGRGVIVGMLAPNTNPQKFESGQAMLIRKGAVLTLQVHYTATGTPTSDLSSIGIIFAKEPPKQEVFNNAFLVTNFAIPPGAPRHRVDSAIEFTQDSHIIGMVPHTHLRGSGWEYTLVRPDGTREKILSVPRYDFNWQTYYEFATPLAVAKGSRIEAEAYYNNSTSNKSNPNPAAEVHFGEQTWDEMQYTAITFTVDEAKSPASGQQ